MSLLLDGKKAAFEEKEKLKEEFFKQNREVTLAIVHFNDEASNSYLKGRMKIASELGVAIKDVLIDELISEDSLINIIKELNDNPLIDGIMVDRPVPRQYDENYILNTIDPNKDVDGCTDVNMGKLFANKDAFVANTPLAAINLAKHYNIELAGKNVLIIGRSLNVGKPLAILALKENATVTIAHSKTKDIKAKCKEADIIFLCIGKANFLHLEDVKEDAVVIDIGINFDENNKLCGDASKEIYGQIAAYSPVPGGVGVMTNVCLMSNVLKAYKLNK